MAQRAIPASIGQQVFVISSALAGGLAGLMLASRLANTREVSTRAIVLASSISAVATIGSVFIITSTLEQ